MASNVESISLSSCIYHDVTRHLWIKSETSNSLTHQEEQFNSSSPSAEYMHQWTGSALVQVMACRQFGTKPLPEPMLAVNSTPGNKLQWNSYWNSIIFFQENSFEIVICQNGSHFVQVEMSWKHAFILNKTQEAVSTKMLFYPYIRIPITKIRRSHNHLIFDSYTCKKVP